MRKIPLGMVKPGMILAKDIFGDKGQILLRADIEMKPRYLKYLEQAEVEYVYVRDSRIRDVIVEDTISEKTRQEARNLVRDITGRFESNGPGGKISKAVNLQDRLILETVNRIIEELLDSNQAVVQLVDIRSKDNYLFAHSVNCAVLATLLAKKMKFNLKELRWVATGALFHDLGMIILPENIVNKPGDLSEEEFKMVTEHPLAGFEMFKKTAIFDARPGAVILQHHERYQGQGYPRGLSGKNIYPLAQITGIADVYDALTSDRPYRKAYKPHEAVDMLLSWGEVHFDAVVIQQFLSLIAAYPIGSHVLLSNGDSGLVIANNPGFTLRPAVRVLYRNGAGMDPHPQPYELDLSQTLDLTVTDLLE